MLDVMTAMLCNQAMNFLVGGTVPKRNGNAHPNIQPQDVFSCRDGALVLAVGNDGQFVRLCAALGRPALAADARFATNAARVRNNATLYPLLRDLFGQRDRADWVAALDAVGVPCGPINTVAEVFADAQVRHRGMRIDLPHPLAGTVPSVASPLRLTNAPLQHERAPPLLGEHTEEVLREAGLSDAEIAQLRARGAI
jgi:crotonobetainyl-CoA:carnitine CoA-transferase CaiB-like acyl-CoA transferase